MNSLLNKKILVGITGGIAAYKTAELVRALVKAGAEVKVVMTQAASQFVTALTLQALSKNPVYTDLLDPEQEAAMGHIQLARWADAILVAPASADFIARLAHGLANDLLTTLCLATTAPISLAPAMNQQMWLNAAVQANVAQLKARQIILLGPDVGAQACGEFGPGRMLEPIVLLERFFSLLRVKRSNLEGAEDMRLRRHFVPHNGQKRGDATDKGHLAHLNGKKIVITAGPTQEAIDPVRYITNHSSGKMGYALARQAEAHAAEVYLISGPSQLDKPANVTVIDVVTADQMKEAVMQLMDSCDIFIATAAVADYKPVVTHPQKIKRNKSHMTLELAPNPDIVSIVAHQPNPPFVVGFAAETNELAQNAKKKLTSKKLDMIVANMVGVGRGFNVDVNEVFIYCKKGDSIHLPLTSKMELAEQILHCIVKSITHKKEEVN